MRPAQAVVRVLLLIHVAACLVGTTAPPPELRVTSPKRGLLQSSAGRIVVEGTALPGSDGSAISKVLVNDVPVTVGADGSFVATIDVPLGALLLRTVAYSESGGSITDARAIQVGERRAVGSNVERAITATLSADAFAKLSSAAGPIIKNRDLTAMLAPMQPMVSLGDSIANVKLSITKLALGDASFKLTPVDGGLEFSVDLAKLDVSANAAYGGTLVPDGTKTINITADALTLAGTLVVTPAGTAGFSTKIASPTVRTTNLKLSTSGLIGAIVDLLQNNLASTTRDIITSAAERALQPLITEALGALAGPQRFDVLGKKLEFQIAPAAVAFSRAGALVTIDMKAIIEGSESSAGFIFTPNGTPTLDVRNGIQLGLADDLLNELLAEVHALGLLDIHLNQDFGLFDQADIKLTLPPMVGASSKDGDLRLVLGDMIASLSKQGQPLLSAAINAQIDLEAKPGAEPQDVALEFGHVGLFVNLLDSAAADDDTQRAAAAGIGLQLESLTKFVIKVPVPSVAGVSLDTLALRADSGYVVVSGHVK